MLSKIPGVTHYSLQGWFEYMEVPLDINLCDLEIETGFISPTRRCHGSSAKGRVTLVLSQ